jgi:hypothetical protein
VSTFGVNLGITSRQTANPPGDLVRALARLAPGSPTEVAAIASVLGYNLRGQIGDERAPMSASRPQPTPAPAGNDIPFAHEQLRAERTPSATSSLRTLRSSIERLEAGFSGARKPNFHGPSELLSRVQSSSALPLAPPVRTAYLEEILPLFEPQYTRAIITRMAAQVTSGTEIDVSALVLKVASEEAFHQVPMRARLAVSGGLQLLLDIGSTMLPFRLDVRQMVRSVSAVVGFTRVDICWFRGFPGRGLVDRLGRRVLTYHPPQPGRSVLAVTDMGVGGQEHPLEAHHFEAWLAFAKQLQQQRSVLTVLTPYRRDLYPAEFGRYLRVVVWDRGTKLRTLLRRPGGPRLR